MENFYIETKAQLELCKLENARVRGDNKEQIAGFSWALFLCLCFEATIPFLIIKVLEFPVAIAILGGLGGLTLSLIGACIYFIITGVKGLKKCKEIDTKIVEQEEKLWELYEKAEVEKETAGLA